MEQQSDRFLDELQDGLKDICGVEVSLSTVWRTLKRLGFTMKKVSSEQWRLS